MVRVQWRHDDRFGRWLLMVAQNLELNHKPKKLDRKCRATYLGNVFLYKPFDINMRNRQDFEL
jgi:hypothetical protein